MNDLGRWTSWAADCWETARSAWLRRDGQDHYYRTTVVVPALIHSSRRFLTTVRSLADLGSGDGFSTDCFVASATKARERFEEIVLIDRSAEQLGYAVRRTNLRAARPVVRDLLQPGWAGLLHHLPTPTLLLSLFVFQELASLTNPVTELAKALRPSDLAMLLVVAPSYAETLRRRGLVRVVQKSPPGEHDWLWAGEYPIGAAGSSFVLPHFQRRTSDYSNAFRRAGLRLLEIRYLSVPDTTRAHRVFRSSVYDERILGVRSSLLFVVGKVKVNGP